MRCEIPWSVALAADTCERLDWVSMLNGGAPTLNIESEATGSPFRVIKTTG